MNEVTYRQLRLDVCLEGVLGHDDEEGHLGLLARGGAGDGEPYSLLVCPSCSSRAGLRLGVRRFDRVTVLLIVIGSLWYKVEGRVKGSDSCTLFLQTACTLRLPSLSLHLQSRALCCPTLTTVLLVKVRELFKEAKIPCYSMLFSCSRRSNSKLRQIYAMRRA